MVDELSIYVPDRPGELARILGILKDAKVNILGLTIDEVQSVSIARFILDEPETARIALEEKNITVSFSKVFTVRLPHTIGALSRLITVLSKGKINIRYIYLLQLKDNHDPVVVVRVNPKQEKETKEILANNQFEHIKLRDLVV